MSDLWVTVPDVHQHVEGLTSDQVLGNLRDKGGIPFVFLPLSLIFYLLYLTSGWR